jgi:type III pantothenate kinase
MTDHCLLDLGNTRYKWMMQSGLPAGAIKKQVYSKQKAAEIIAHTLLDAKPFQHLLVSSVKSERFNRAFSDACHRVGIATPEFIRIGKHPLISLAYQDISKLGIDRYLALIGALLHYQPPFIVVDAGTVVTFDAVDTSGAHIGGCFFPGRRLLRESMVQGANRISMTQPEESALFADSTEKAVNGGIEQGFTSAVNGILAAMQSKWCKQATTILTGGDAHWLHSRIFPSPEENDRLIFEGIAQVAIENNGIRWD